MNAQFPLPVTPAPLAVYNASLRKSLGSKLFFVDKVPLHEAGLVVDFGCGDGSLLHAIHRMLPWGSHPVGVDKEWTQRQAAIANLLPGTLVVDGLDKFRFPPLRSGPTVCIFSSVLHEAGLKPLEDAAAMGFDYLVVRDMAAPRSYGLREAPQVWQGLVRKHPWPILPSGRSILEDHEQAYGSVTWLDSMVHFLLKYPYAHNWDREGWEDYTGIAPETYPELADELGYEVIHNEQTVTEHFQHRVLKDLGFRPSNVTTHTEVILRKR